MNDARHDLAVLVDLDGTLVDTVGIWRSAYLELADELGVTLDPGFWSLIAGRSMLDSLRVFGASAAQGDELVARLIDLATVRVSSRGTGVEEGAPEHAGSSSAWQWLPGAQTLLRELTAAGVPTAIVTSAWRSFVTALQAADGGLSITLAICGDEVARSKPAPDPYLRAAAALGVAPERCLVIEDSPTGVAAAEAAGMVVIAIPHAGPVTPAPGRAVRPSLAGLDLDELLRLSAALRSERAQHAL
jgi:HAD superfamily hydrolase (TIGR01509 family)